MRLAGGTRPLDEGGGGDEGYAEEPGSLDGAGLCLRKRRRYGLGADGELMKQYIEVRGARQNNLQNIDVNIPRDKLTVITGVSGSGKSSLAFEVIYGEGQRKFLESLSNFSKSRMTRLKKPDVDFVFGLSPVIAIEQKKGIVNPRSTVGTMTDIYDFLRLLFASAGKRVACFATILCLSVRVRPDDRSNPAAS